MKIVLQEEKSPLFKTVNDTLFKDQNTFSLKPPITREEGWKLMKTNFKFGQHNVDQ